MNAFIELETNTLTREENCVLGDSAKPFFLYNSDDRFSAGDEAFVQTSAPHSYTSSYQQFSSRAYLEFDTHRHSSSSKTAVATLKYSPTSTLYPKVIYAIVFSAGLNGL